MAKISMQFPISEMQKADVESYAAEHKISTAEAIRRALATMTGYDYDNEVVGRKTKWASPEERTKYNRAMAKARRARNSQIMKLVGEGKSREARALAQAELDPTPYLD